MNPIKSCHLAACLGILAITPPCVEASVLVDYNLTGTEHNRTVWTTLTNANPARTPDSGTGSLAVGAPGYQASAGLYSYMGNYSVTVGQTATLDIESVIFQLELQPNPDYPVPFGGGPLLTITTTSGAVQLAANLFAVNGSENLTTSFGPGTFTGYSWQWDLSGYGDTITSVSVTAPLSIHSSVIAAQIDAFGSHLSLVPEPSAMLLSFIGLGLILRRRQR